MADKEWMRLKRCSFAEQVEAKCNADRQYASLAAQQSHMADQARYEDGVNARLGATIASNENRRRTPQASIALDLRGQREQQQKRIELVKIYDNYGLDVDKLSTLIQKMQLVRSAINHVFHDDDDGSEVTPAEWAELSEAYSQDQDEDFDIEFVVSNRVSLGE